MNIEVKAKKGDKRIQSFVIHYSVFDIRHSEKHKIAWLGIVTQPVNEGYRQTVPVSDLLIFRFKPASGYSCLRFW